MKQCVVDGCEEKPTARGMCNKHYLRLRITGTTDPTKFARGSLEERFWRKVEQRGSDECWGWAGKIERNGYGRIQQGGKGSPMLGAHRVSYELHYGPIPDGMVVRHKCDNPGCVNPNHLEIGTSKQNTADMYRRGRQGNSKPPVHSGEAHHKSRLTEDLVRQIRASDRTARSWAQELGVSPSSIERVKLRKTWRHVE